MEFPLLMGRLVVVQHANIVGGQGAIFCMPVKNNAVFLVFQAISIAEEDKMLLVIFEKKVLHSSYVISYSSYV